MCCVLCVLHVDSVVQVICAVCVVCVMIDVCGVYLKVSLTDLVFFQLDPGGDVAARLAQYITRAAEAGMLLDLIPSDAGDRSHHTIWRGYFTEYIPMSVSSTF